MQCGGLEAGDFLSYELDEIDSGSAAVLLRQHHDQISSRLALSTDRVVVGHDDAKARVGVIGDRPVAGLLEQPFGLGEREAENPRRSAAGSLGGASIVVVRSIVSVGGAGASLITVVVSPPPQPIRLTPRQSNAPMLQSRATLVRGGAVMLLRIQRQGLHLHLPLSSRGQ
jgi:hypothetical protein